MMFMQFCEKEIQAIRQESCGLLRTKLSHQGPFIFPGPSDLDNLKGIKIFLLTLV